MKINPFFIFFVLREILAANPLYFLCILQPKIFAQIPLAQKDSGRKSFAFPLYVAAKGFLAQKIPRPQILVAANPLYFLCILQPKKLIRKKRFWRKKLFGRKPFAFPLYFAVTIFWSKNIFSGQKMLGRQSFVFPLYFAANKIFFAQKYF